MKATASQIIRRESNAVPRRRQKLASPADRAASSPRRLSIRTLLVPTDFSEASENAVRYAVALAKHFDAKLTFLYVVEPVGTPDFATSFPLAMDDDKVACECKGALQKVIERNGIEPEFVEKVVVRYGRAYNEIAAAARSLRADLIVISTHGYTGLKHALLGSTTERLIRYARCPVLVVRAEDSGFLTDAVKPSTEDVL